MNHRRRNNSILAALVLAGLLVPQSVGLFAAERGDKPKRARPPKWSADVLDAFFEDAREKLEGERPDYAAEEHDRGKPIASRLTRQRSHASGCVRLVEADRR